MKSEPKRLIRAACGASVRIDGPSEQLDIAPEASPSFQLLQLPPIGATQNRADIAEMANRSTATVRNHRDTLEEQVV